MNKLLNFVIIIERGSLEPKASLLVESIRRFPALRDSPIYVVQPRQGPVPSQATMRLLARHEVRYLYADLNRVWRHHGMVNKTYAAALVESLVENSAETLVYLDADMIVCKSPEEGLSRAGKEAVAVAPIAEWQVGKIGQLAGQPLIPYWKMVYELCGLEALPNWSLTTPVDNRNILPYFNSGMISVQPRLGIFRRWQENMERLAKDPRAAKFPLDSREFFYLDQAMLTGTLLANFSRGEIRVLDHRYNYPLHAHHLLPAGIRALAIEDIQIVHYHGHFTNLYWMDDIEVREPLRSWLLERLPFRPGFRLARGPVALTAAHLMSRFPLRRLSHRLAHRIPGLSRTIPHPARSGEQP